MPRSLYPDPHWRLIRSISVRSSIQVSWKSEVCAMKEESDPLFWNTKWSEQVRINRQTTLFWKCTLWSSWPWQSYVYEWISVLVCLLASVSLGRRRCDVGLFIRTSLVNVISQDAFRVFWMNRVEFGGQRSHQGRVCPVVLNTNASRGYLEIWC